MAMAYYRDILLAVMATQNDARQTHGQSQSVTVYARLSKRAQVIRTAAISLLALAGCGNGVESVDSARSGQVLTLHGNVGQLRIENKSWKPIVTINASAATFSGIVIKNVTGLKIVGGLVVGSGPKSYGIDVNSAHNITIDGMTITGAYRGIVIGRSQDIVVRNNELIGLISDGVDIAASQRIMIELNRCSKFNPTVARLDESGKVISGDHPDCIQGWSKRGEPPTADVIVRGNQANGSMQGVFFRDPLNGGFDRLLIEGNILRTARSNAIFLEGARDAIVRRNRISSVPGATQLNTGRPVLATIVFKQSTGSLCENEVMDAPGEFSQRC